MHLRPKGWSRERANARPKRKREKIVRKKKKIGGFKNTENERDDDRERFRKREIVEENIEMTKFSVSSDLGHYRTDSVYFIETGSEQFGPGIGTFLNFYRYRYFDNFSYVFFFLISLIFFL